MSEVQNLIHPNGFLIEKRGKSLMFHLRHYGTILYQIKSLLLERIPEGSDIIVRAYMTLWVSQVLKCRKLKTPYVTLEYQVTNKKTIWKDKSSFLEINTLYTKWYQILVQVLIGNVRDYKPFWNDQCAEMSRRLWLPIETDSVALGTNLLNLSLTNQESNSWFIMKKMLNPNHRNLPTISCQSSMCTHADKWENEDTKKISGTKKIKLYPTQLQRKILNEWFNTSRYVYNKTLSFIKNDKPDDFPLTKFNLRDKFVTKRSTKCDPLYVEYEKRIKKIKELKDGTENENLEEIRILEQESLMIKDSLQLTENPEINDWETNTPKEVRAYAIDDLLTARKAALSNLRNGNISKFKINFRSKKNVSQSITIQKSSIKFSLKKHKKKNTKNRIGIYASILGYINIKKQTVPKTCNYDMKLNKYNNDFYLCVTYNKPIDRSIPKYKSCALDPGARTMHVLYSEHEVLKFQQDNNIIKKINKKIDIMTSLRKKAQNLKQKYHSYNKRLKNLRMKMRNRIDDMHYKIINYLTNTYQKIYLPSFDSQDMVSSNKLHSSSNRMINQLCHFKFKQRLQSKANTKSHCEVYIVTEDYTTKTCTNCGVLNDVQGLKKIECKSCKLKYDRDINGGRNIFIKSENKQ